jgi:hypothetical protein
MDSGLRQKAHPGMTNLGVKATVGQISKILSSSAAKNIPLPV